VVEAMKKSQMLLGPVQVIVTTFHFVTPRHQTGCKSPRIAPLRKLRFASFRDPAPIFNRTDYAPNLTETAES